MEKVEIGGLSLDRFVLGAGRMGDPAEKDECFRILDEYRERGFATVDTARSYKNGAAEEFLGEYLQKNNCRQSLTLISKGGFPLSTERMYETRLTEADLKADVEHSLKALKTDVIDLYFLHRDDVSVAPEELLERANKLVSEGKVRALGASNWTAGRIAQANRYAAIHHLSPFVCSQINYSLAVTTPALTGDLTHIVMNDAEYGWYRDSQFPIIAYSVQAKGFFTKAITGDALKRSGQLSYPPLEENYRRLARIKALSDQTKLSIPALLMAFILSQPLNSFVLGGFSTVKQLREVLPGLDMTLEKEILDYLTGKAGE